ncbi:carboxynorspermidine decarboxylase [Colwellia sp. D2M02]|uniref:carboxynorspermidine decarboxylase n=1 Tax=Colwellia sp. D2M02 TaxID=2841562 RepID=UPI001C0883BC|nr:carboxynorspermidine decarboxylase [Colwellia sp. D2M02]MBU2893124.1 carboxynorspermidine decarboxylase [Colwellia sp. D2M02]
MQFTDFTKLDLQRLPSPCFVVDQVAIERNLTILNHVASASGAKVLAALKAFSMWQLGPLTASYLDGICASGLHEAKLGFDEYRYGDKKSEVHVYSAAFSEADVKELLTFADHIVFNSVSQWQRFKPLCLQAQIERPSLHFGLRINPEHSEGSVPLYDPCAEGSRLGIKLYQLADIDLTGISGLHFHTLCEQGFAELNRTLNAVENKFSHLLTQMQWVNFGGGHHITAPDYQVDALIERIKSFSAQHQVQVYLEPGEAIAIGSGILCAEVLDIFEKKAQSEHDYHAILDTSATCHMPDTLEMPYRPDITNSGEVNEFIHNYRFGGLTCLAGDIINDYSFVEPLTIGQRIVFEDMAHYTMVKTSTFNGTKLPAIALWNSQTDELTLVKQFTYDDFKQRLS